MKSLHTSVLVCVILAASIGVVHALPAGQPCWAELPQQDGSVLFCDLSSANMVRFIGDTVTLTAYFPDKSQIFAQTSNPDAARKLREIVRKDIGRWVQIDGISAGEVGFLNLAMVVAVRFGTDEKGGFARVLTRGDSVVPMDAKDRYSGWEVRDSASIQRLKSSVTPPP